MYLPVHGSDDSGCSVVFVSAGTAADRPMANAADLPPPTSLSLVSSFVSWHVGHSGTWLPDFLARTRQEMQWDSTKKKAKISPSG